MRVLVCGGRDFYDWRLLEDTLYELNKEEPITWIIHGDAAGADRLAKQYARYHCINFETYPADWKTHGKAAGAIRNQQMLDEGRPTTVVAFPGGAGTADMVRRVKQHPNIRLIEVNHV